MPRAIVILRTCDVCSQDGGPDAPAVASFVASVVPEGEQADARALDLCEAHAYIATDFLAIVAKCAPADLAIMAEPRAIPQRRAPIDDDARPEWDDEIVCPVCNSSVRRHSMLNHLWIHRSDKRPKTGLICPECGDRFAVPQSTGVHRWNKHGFDAWAEALQGAPGWDAGRAQRWVKHNRRGNAA